MRIVWFKRDLRTADHAALSGAAAHGPALPLAIIEPDYWAQPDVSGRQYAFFAECVSELRAELAALGQPLILRIGDAVACLEDLRARFGVTHLHSHQETGGDWTYARDRRVGDWARTQGVAWIEHRQSGVIRRIGKREGWAKRWDAMMRRPQIAPPPTLKPIAGIDRGAPPDASEIGIAPDPCPDRQIGGRAAALDLLDSFFGPRGQHYRKEMSSPLTAYDACSRLSPHLAWGTLSSREAAQAGGSALDDLRAVGPAAPDGQDGSIKSFLSRLHWRCHFMQKLESEPRIEFENLHPAYDGLRADAPDPERLERWATGQTGWPFVDACMRALIATGWMNFRMRAMAMAVASYHLWLPWRPPAIRLGRLFTDFEPGIHYPQAQMQSGVTGINTVRIYNPVKQGRDQDPDGEFIARWVPELSACDADARHEPWRFGGVAGYPSPICDHLAAAREARSKIWSVRGGTAYRETANAIQKRHGSRASGSPRTGRRPKRKTTIDSQLSFDV